jgi:hypothetical protein
MNTNGPVFGFDAPHEASKCDDPEFANECMHRVTIIPTAFYCQGIPGFSTAKKCVSCNKVFDHGFFYPLHMVEEHFSDVLDEIGFDRESWVEERDWKDDPIEIDDYMEKDLNVEPIHK